MSGLSLSRRGSFTFALLGSPDPPITELIGLRLKEYATEKEAGEGRESRMQGSEEGEEGLSNKSGMRRGRNKVKGGIINRRKQLFC